MFLTLTYFFYVQSNLFDCSFIQIRIYGYINFVNLKCDIIRFGGTSLVDRTTAGSNYVFRNQVNKNLVNEVYNFECKIAIVYTVNINGIKLGDLSYTNLTLIIRLVVWWYHTLSDKLKIIPTIHVKERCIFSSTEEFLRSGLITKYWVECWKMKIRQSKIFNIIDSIKQQLNHLRCKNMKNILN